jgi:GTP-binding protein HflX
MHDTKKTQTAQNALQNALKSQPRCILVALDLGKAGFADSVEEMRLLASSAGANVVAQNISRRSRLEAATFIGSGKAAEIAQTVIDFEADLVLFAHALSPAQQRNLERIFNVRIVDRTALILDIFALRAQSHEGKMQVELAQLQHLSTRLVKMWSHLERQRGGIGMRGPGESQLEMDKRIIGDKIKALKERLEKLRKQRNTQRRGRNRAGVFTVSIVGYTNAGKSTLFNVLTKANSYAADQLFATLDTTSRKLYVDGQNLVMTDTVGFIRELPTTLIAAFRATLEEALNADLLLHVIDIASPERDAHIAQVNAVLADIGVGDIAQAWVLNKCDLVDLPPRFEPAAPVSQDLLDSMLVDTVPTLTVSAKTGHGMDLLRQYLAQAAQAQALAMARSAPHLNHNREWSQHASDQALDESLDN